MLRRVSIFLTMLAATGALANEVPYFDRKTVPDYTARFKVVHTYGRDKTNERVVLQHGGWTRVEEGNEGKTVISYGNFSKNLVLRTGKDDEGNVWMSVTQADPAKDSFGFTDARELKQVEAIGNEHCRWLELIHGELEQSKSGPIWRTCLTGDGIEVATTVLFSNGQPMSEARLVELDRKRLSTSAVLPPADLFDAETWLKPLHVDIKRPSEIADFEVELQNPTAKLRLMRHYPWWYRERTGKDGSVSALVWNELADQGISYSASSGKRQLDARRSPLDPKRPYSKLAGWSGLVRMNERGQFLGETCTWYDRMPNVADAGLRHCLTVDGIPLKEIRTSGWGRGEVFEVTKIVRRPIAMNEIRLDPVLLDPTAWGYIPEN